jgi:ABC-type transporter MlaC component
MDQDNGARLNRRAMLGGAAATAGLAASGLASPPAEAATDLAVSFMNQLRAPLLQAARTASAKQFLRLIQGHADVTGIALYSLGSFRQGLERSHRSRYYHGVARYMSRFFALSSQEYRVVGAKVISPSWKDGESVYVDSKVNLEDGSVYTVRWELKQRGGTFKVVNVRINLGVVPIWLAYFQRLQFEEFIRKRGGSVNALVAALSP